MTSYEIKQLPFDPSQFDSWALAETRALNWPVVYTLTGGREVYVGETINMVKRIRSHKANVNKQSLEQAYVVVDESFNKSACLDLESSLIRWFSGDGAHVRNRNIGVVNADYFNRDEYQRRFREIFEGLRAEGLFERSIRQIENRDLFKLSPFKALTREQGNAVSGLLDAVLADLREGSPSMSVVRGGPGTGKTIVAIYFVKLLRDIGARLVDDDPDPDADTTFAEYFTTENSELLRDLRIGFVIPQQSLRKSVANVFAQTPGLESIEVLDPFKVGESAHTFDLLIVDETHRLNHRANQPSGPNNKRFADINVELFGADDMAKTQLDWIKARSRHQILMLDAGQSVRPADLPAATTAQVIADATAQGRVHHLVSQMRLQNADGYVEYLREVFAGTATPKTFEGYDLRFFDDFGEMRRAIKAREQETGLARLLAGYAWKWKSKGKANRTKYDIKIDDERLRWNQTAVDWINSPTSAEEVGSIHTVQGYDLNYAGVIIGADLRYDEGDRRVVFDRANYFDTKGRENNRKLGIVYSDDDIRAFVINIYVVLMTRGMLGTYVYVVDEPLREYLRPYFAEIHRLQVDVLVSEDDVAIDAVGHSPSGAIEARSYAVEPPA